MRARLAAALVMAVILPFWAHAQSASKADVRRAPMGWDGRPVTRTCHADANDLEGLKATLIEHEKARVGFKNKIRHGVFSGGELSGGRIRSAAPSFLVELISRHLLDIAPSGETAAGAITRATCSRGRASARPSNVSPTAKAPTETAQRAANDPAAPGRPWGAAGSEYDPSRTSAHATPATPIRVPSESVT